MTANARAPYTPGVRTWVKVALAAAALVVLVWAAIAGTTAFFVFRHLDTRSATEADSLRAFETVRVRFGPRPPLIEIVDPRGGDVRINRLQSAESKAVGTFHVLAWKAEDRALIRTDAPIWLLRFNTVNILSQLGVGPAKFRLTVQDVERYGPGIIVDYGPPGSDHVLLWVD